MNKYLKIKKIQENFQKNVKKSQCRYNFINS